MCLTRDRQLTQARALGLTVPVDATAGLLEQLPAEPSIAGWEVALRLLQDENADVRHPATAAAVPDAAAPEHVQMCCACDKPASQHKHAHIFSTRQAYAGHPSVPAACLHSVY